jgi:hypothetical protein
VIRFRVPAVHQDNAKFADRDLQIVRDPAGGNTRGTVQYPGREPLPAKPGEQLDGYLDHPLSREKPGGFPFL